MAQGDIFSGLTWLGPDESPFRLRVLDCRPFSTAMISTTKDPNIAARFNQLRCSSGEEHRGRHPENAVVARCDLSYPFDEESKDGPLFVARQMEEKWDIYLYDGHLYFSRSWTGDLVYRATVEFREGKAVITAVEAGRAKGANDPGLAVRAVDSLMKTHLYRTEAPHPLPRDYPDDKRAIALAAGEAFHPDLQSVQAAMASLERHCPR
jgi:hypothetical protein